MFANGWANVNPTYSFEVDYDTDTSSGQSGAGVNMFLFGGNAQYVVAVHRGSTGVTGHANYGRRLDSTVLGFIGATSAL